MHRSSLPLAFVLAFSVVALGCSDRCVAGITISCPCLGGTSGIQTCRGDGTFGACQCGIDAGNTGDAGSIDDADVHDTGVVSDVGPVDTGAPVDAPMMSEDANADAFSDPCAGHVFYAGSVASAGPVWATLPSSAGMTGLEAGAAACAAAAPGSDHACDYEEVVLAAANGELAAIPAGTTAWLQRTTTVDVAGSPSPPGPGGNCNDWTYATNHIGDGEYITFDVAGVPTYHFDNDTTYDPAFPRVIPGDLDCGGVTRSILCCYTVCM
jgi:hypothetical protein